MSNKKERIILAVIFAAAFLLRLLPALNVFDFPERFIRPDTATYLAPAQALLEGKFFGTGRAPGYIFFLRLLQNIFCPAQTMFFLH